MSLFFYYIGYYLKCPKNNSINFSELVVENESLEVALKKQYELEELHIQVQGMNADYKNLSLETKRRVDYTYIAVIEIKVDDTKQKSKILQQIFANLNKKGTLLSEQEQRNGIYACGFYDMLREFNRRNERWRKIWGLESAKEDDMEALLRFCALRKYVTVKKVEGGI